MFATDRDLLALEPRLFFDVAWTAQKRIDLPAGGAVNAQGDTLTLTGADAIAAGVRPGFVALFSDNPPWPLEVVEILSPTALRISRPRARPNDPPIPATPATAQRTVVHTFTPQIALVHEALLRDMGIAPAGAPEPPSRITEDRITNPRDLALAEALAALHLIFAAAAASVGASSAMWTRAALYAQRAREERARIAARIDLDDDGVPDITRRTRPSALLRA